MCAPEDANAFFGGDPENFNFPRYDLDVRFSRIFEADGKPWKAEDFLPFSRTGVKEGELTFVSGNPGGTNRGMKLAQIQDQHDRVLLDVLMGLPQAPGLGQRIPAAREKTNYATPMTICLVSKTVLKPCRASMSL